MSGMVSGPVKLENIIQKYPWGSKTLIPELTGRQNPAGDPWAEMWMGAHPRGPSKLITPEDGRIGLAEEIDLFPDQILGPQGSARYKGSLPFLFKVLAAELPLSIQAHPDREQAEEGYVREEQRGIPIDDFNRNYRDRNHKPEIICALTEFTAMCGFRAPGDIHSFYEQVGSKMYGHMVAPYTETDEPPVWIRSFFEALMNLSDKERHVLNTDVLEWTHGKGRGTCEAALIQRFSQLHGNDAGIQAPLFLNTVTLRPGEALYQPAGVLHAYVKGMGVELMANSDNVLRGGLTRKHVDKKELLRVLSFEPRKAEVLHGILSGPNCHSYPAPVDEFQLLRIHSTGHELISRGIRSSVDICICTEGEFVLGTGSDDAGREDRFQNMQVRRGDSFLVPYSLGAYTLEGSGSVFIATIPERKG